MEITNYKFQITNFGICYLEFGISLAKQGPGDIAQLGERQLCKLEVTGSIPVISTIFAGV